MTDKYNQRVMKKGRESNNEAFMAATPQNKKKHDIECHNCHKKGHTKAECWAKGGSKEGQGPRRGSTARGSTARGSATAATTETDIEAWALIDECTDIGSQARYWAKDSEDKGEDKDKVWEMLEEAESDEEDELVATAGRPRTSTVKMDSMNPEHPTT